MLLGWFKWALKAAALVLMLVIAAGLFLLLWVKFVQPTTAPIIETVKGFLSLLFFFGLAVPAIVGGGIIKLAYEVIPLLGVLVIGWIGYRIIARPLIYRYFPLDVTKQQHERIEKPYRDRELGNYVPTFTCKGSGRVIGFYTLSTDENQPSGMSLREWNEAEHVFDELLLPCGDASIEYVYLLTTLPTLAEAVKHAAASSATGEILDLITGGLIDVSGADDLAKAIVEKAGEKIADEIAGDPPEPEHFGPAHLHILVPYGSSARRITIKVSDASFGKYAGWTDLPQEDLEALIRTEITLKASGYQFIGISKSKELDRKQAVVIEAMPIAVPSDDPAPPIVKRQFRLNWWNTIEVYQPDRSWVFFLQDHGLRRLGAAVAGLCIAILVHGTVLGAHGGIIPTPLVDSEARASAWSRFALRTMALIEGRGRWTNGRGLQYVVVDRPTTVVVNAPQQGASPTGGLARGDLVYAYADENGWSYVKAWDQIGWIASSELADTKPPPLIVRPAEPQTEPSRKDSPVNPPQDARPPAPPPLPPIAQLPPKPSASPTGPEPLTTGSPAPPLGPMAKPEMPVAGSGSVPPPEKVPLPRPRPAVQLAAAPALHGTWRGQFSCGSDVVNLLLTITGQDLANLEATFRFQLVSVDATAPFGEYMMIGSYDPGQREVRLMPTRWTERPAGYRAVGFAATLNDRSDSMQGQVIYPNCSWLQLSKLRDRQRG